MYKKILSDDTLCYGCFIYEERLYINDRSMCQTSIYAYTKGLKHYIYIRMEKCKLNIKIKII
jgi:hypothetical protein